MIKFFALLGGFYGIIYLIAKMKFFDKYRHPDAELYRLNLPGHLWKSTFLKRILDKCGYPELYDKLIELGYETSFDAKVALKDRRLFKTLGIDDALEQEKILGALQKENSEKLRILWALAGAGIFLILYVGILIYAT